MLRILVLLGWSSIASATTLDDPCRNDHFRKTIDPLMGAPECSVRAQLSTNGGPVFDIVHPVGIGGR